MRILRPTVCGLAVLLGAAAAGQPQQPAQPQQPVRLEDLPPALRLGVRADGLRRKIPVIRQVVLVPDAASYAEAVARWTSEARYPVLIDDGTWMSREDIARFVRAFAPAKVVRWSRAAAGAPADADGRRTLVEAAVARSWGVDASGATMLAVMQRWGQIGLVPPGIVVADPSDPAWTAALALSAGHAQPVVWVRAVQGVSGEIPRSQAAEFELGLESACEDLAKLGLSWRGLGDHIDAVTLCLNSPARVTVGPNEYRATTDWLGRTEPESQSAARWAWTGQVHGSEREAAYRAMCALFIQSRKAWLFDGYKAQAPYDQWDSTGAAGVLRQAGWDAVVDDTPSQGERDWRQRASRPMDAGLIMVNSQGNFDFFQLEPGVCRPGDVPILSTPAMVHFVHSWSSLWPANRDTVAGRWLERGVYAYMGSVQEPFLQAFVPTPMAARRLCYGFPWGAAVRLDAGPAWKLAVFGDPLITIGPPAPVSDAALPLDGVLDIAEGLPAALTEKRYADALAALTLLGRDADAARLGAAVFADDARAATPAVAEIAFMAFFRAGTPEQVVTAFQSLGPAEAADEARRDVLWHACYPSLARADDAMIGALRLSLRDDQVGRDAADLARPMARVMGRQIALDMLGAARGAVKTDMDREQIEEAIRALGGGR